MVEQTQGGGSSAGAAESARAVVDRLLPSVQTLLEVTRLARSSLHGCLGRGQNGVLRACLGLGCWHVCNDQNGALNGALNSVDPRTHVTCCVVYRKA